MELVLATGNKGKLTELRQLLPDGFRLHGLSDFGLPTQLPETGTTFQANALQKARYVWDRTGLACLADDSGLEVRALGGAPGVWSARYAGPAASDQENVQKLLDTLAGQTDREARFVCVIALIINNKEYFFEGFLNGRIADVPSGQSGFGYDPVFIPEGFEQPLATFTGAEKNRISHRGMAIRKLLAFLTGLAPQSS